MSTTPTPEEQLADFMAKQQEAFAAFMSTLQPAAPEAPPVIQKVRLPNHGTLGGVIQREREKQRLSQSDLARRTTGLTASSISRAEVNADASVLFKFVVGVSLALNLRPSDLIRRLEDECPAMVPSTEGPPLVLAAD